MPSISQWLLCVHLLLISLGADAFGPTGPNFNGGNPDPQRRGPGREGDGLPSERYVPPPPEGGGLPSERFQPPPPQSERDNMRPFDDPDMMYREPYDEPEESYIELSYQDYFDGTKPDSFVSLAGQNFVRQGRSIVEQIAETQINFISFATGLKDRVAKLPPESLGVTLSNDGVREAEERRIRAGGNVDAHPVSLALYKVGCLFLENLFRNRPIQRFWFLEVIARIPHFSYVSMLHLYESFGWFRAVELRKVHSAEDWNELHHLLIMESLGGNRLWSDRFLGYHVALTYYWVLVLVYSFSPRIAYQFMELLEAHAVDTYATFVKENRERLQSLPPPSVARSYYQTGDLYLFDDFQISRTPGSRRPPCDNLLDVFQNICEDEGEHVKTMRACQDYARFGVEVVSPHLYMDPEKKRQLWNEWSNKMNNQGREGFGGFPGEGDRRGGGRFPGILEEWGERFNTFRGKRDDDFPDRF